MLKTVMLYNIFVETVIYFIAIYKLHQSIAAAETNQRAAKIL